MYSYSGTTLIRLLHFSLRTFFLLLHMTGDTKGTAVLYSYCSIKHTVTSPQWTVGYCYTSLKMQRFWLVLLHLHTMLELLHLHTIYTPRLHIKAHISDVNSFVSLQFTSQSFVPINPSPPPQRWMIRMQFHALSEACVMFWFGGVKDRGFTVCLASKCGQEPDEHQP